MNIFENDSSPGAIVLIVLAALIPIGVILFTLKTFRKKRARGEEQKEDKTFESVKEERLRKRGDYGKK